MDTGLREIRFAHYKLILEFRADQSKADLWELISKFSADETIIYYQPNVIINPLLQVVHKIRHRNLS